MRKGRRIRSRRGGGMKGSGEEQKDEQGCIHKGWEWRCGGGWDWESPLSLLPSLLRALGCQHPSLPLLSSFILIYLPLFPPFFLSFCLSFLLSSIFQLFRSFFFFFLPELMTHSGIMKPLRGVRHKLEQRPRAAGKRRVEGLEWGRGVRVCGGGGSVKWHHTKALYLQHASLTHGLIIAAGSFLSLCGTLLHRHKHRHQMAPVDLHCAALPKGTRLIL